jgi:DNA-directed RNA polymerase specialized sigma24 family protein
MMMTHAAGSRPQPEPPSARDPVIARFERLIAPRVDAAFNLAVWLVGSRSDAEEIVLGACLRAFNELDEVRDRQALVRLLAIVHAACYGWLRANRGSDRQDRCEHGPARRQPETSVHRLPPGQKEPEQHGLTAAVAAMAVEEREVLILHEIEHLTCREIAAVTNTSINLTRSRLLSAAGRLHVTMRPRLSLLPATSP